MEFNSFLSYIILDLNEVASLVGPNVLPSKVCVSDPIPVNSGVVQGSVLGSLIFILAINDINDCLDCSEVNPTSCSISADDLKLYSSYDSVRNNPSLVNTIKNIWNVVMTVAISKSIRIRVYYCTLVIPFRIGLNIPFAARSFYLRVPSET